MNPGAEEIYNQNKKQIEAIHYQKQQYQFNKFDENGDGYLDENEIKELESQMGQTIEDYDGDGRITLNDFNKVFYF